MLLPKLGRSQFKFILSSIVLLNSGLFTQVYYTKSNESSSNLIGYFPNTESDVVTSPSYYVTVIPPRPEKFTFDSDLNVTFTSVIGLYFHKEKFFLYICFKNYANKKYIFLTWKNKTRVLTLRVKNKIF